jgi:fructose-bisphosphate aldolase, class I
LIEQTGALPGIKVDKGTTPLPMCRGEVITEGLDGLRQRLAEYRGLGAKFAKWRAVIDIGDGIPSYSCISTNAHALARYAALCQEEDIVPIVEPEVLMDGGHDTDRCETITEWVLKTVYEQLYYQKVRLEGTVLKPNMVVPGKKSAKRASVEEVAERTVRVLKACVPAAVPGIAFLSGGQSDEEATAHLDAINRIGNLPWKVTFSYGRALQAPVQKTWAGKSENVAAAQRAFAHRARMNGLATLGEWKVDLEKKAA